MTAQKNFYQIIEGIFRKDSRYKPDAYEFVLESLHFTQKKLKRQGHVSGAELSYGMRDFAIDQYGPMAKTVLIHWGITSTDDFGNIVYNMIDKKLLSKNEKDSLEDFKKVYDFDIEFDGILNKMSRFGTEPAENR